jgi:hypothetical protein
MSRSPHFRPDILSIVRWSSVELKPQTLASQLEVHLQAASVKEFQEKHYVVGQSPCQQIRAHDYIPDDNTPNADAESDLIPTFADSMRIIAFPVAGDCCGR